MVVRRTDMVFSMKLTPETGMSWRARHSQASGLRTQRLNIILIEAAFDVLDHQTCLANLGIAHHPDLYDDAAKRKLRGSHVSKTLSYLFFPSSLSPIVELMPSMLLAWLPARGRDVEDEASAEAGEVGVDMICSVYKE